MCETPASPGRAVFISSVSAQTVSNAMTLDTCIKMARCVCTRVVNAIQVFGDCCGLKICTHPHTHISYMYLQVAHDLQIIIPSYIHVKLQNVHLDKIRGILMNILGCLFLSL